MGWRILNSMKKSLFITISISTLLTGQLSSDLITVRDIRLENLKRDYSGKTIRFVDSKSVSNKGILLDVTDENIIISKSGSPIPFNHSKIKYVFVDPKKKEMAMVIGLTALGGISGYLGIILGKSDANNTTKGVASSISASLAGFVGYKAFYKPIKIDISGKTYD
tara:strand:- start:118 stop:612 length:495 start_codon:yes stop_codon:yes gene_type:complete